MLKNFCGFCHSTRRAIINISIFSIFESIHRVNLIFSGVTFGSIVVPFVQAHFRLRKLHNELEISVYTTQLMMPYYLNRVLLVCIRFDATETRRFKRAFSRAHIFSKAEGCKSQFIENIYRQEQPQCLHIYFTRICEGIDVGMHL